jgi:hypothetical protein
MEPDSHSRVFSDEKIWEAKMSQRKLWDKAAACTLAAQATNDPKRREILTCLRELWINLANANPDDRTVAEIAVIERMHDELLGTAATRH